MTDDAPIREPMRPRNRPRRMRPVGPARRPFQPDLDSLLEAAGSVDLVRAGDGRFADLTGRAVDQTVAREAVAEGLVVASRWRPESGERCFLPADKLTAIEEMWNR